MNTLKAVMVALAVALGAILVSGGQSNAASLQPVQTVETKSAVEKVGYHYYHSRWRSHHRWGSRGHGYYGHSRWRSHHRWGSRHYWHSRWRSHHRWGSYRPY